MLAIVRPAAAASTRADRAAARARGRVGRGLDGVVEGPHLWPSIGDAGSQVSFEIQNDLLQSCDGVLMGRRTYESFAAAWPTRSGDSLSDRMNAMRKHVASSTLRAPTGTTPL